VLHLVSCPAIGPPLSQMIIRMVCRAAPSVPKLPDVLAQPGIACALALGHWPLALSTMLPESCFHKKIRHRVIRACMRLLATQYRDRCALFNTAVASSPQLTRDAILELHNRHAKGLVGGWGDEKSDSNVDGANSEMPCDSLSEESDGSGADGAESRTGC